jgi:hypothetical protein
MERIATDTKKVDLFGSGKHGFTEGDPSTGGQPTALAGAWFNAHQEEPARVVEQLGNTGLVAADYEQMVRTLRRLVQWSDWVVQSTGAANDLRAMVYSGTKFCAVGNGGQILTSLDGRSWTAQTPAGGFAGVFYGVAYGAGVFVAVGASGQIQRSADGVTWAVSTPGGGYANEFFGVHFAAGLFVAVGTLTIQTSPDGITWTERLQPTVLYGVYHDGSGLWCAVGGAGKIYTSANGTSWTLRSPAAGSGSPLFYGVTYALGLWMAVGDDDEIQSSPDAITWTRRYNDPPSGALKGVAGDSKVGFVAVGFAGGGKPYAWVSGDGITWFRRSVARPEGVEINAVYYKPASSGPDAEGYWLACGEAGTMLTSLRTL